MNKKPLFTLFLIVATELIGFGLIIPVLPQIGLKFGATGFWLGFLMAAYSIAQFVGAPVLGSLSDRYGRKPILMISQVGTVFSYILLAFSGSYLLFLCARLLDGFTGGNIAIARAYITDVTTKENRTKGMAVIGIGFGVGFILGPALGSILYSSGSHVTAALVAGSLSLTACILTGILLKEPEKKQAITHRAFSLAIWGKALSHPVVQVICFVQFIYMTMFSGFETTFSVFTHTLFGYTERQNSLVFLYVGLLLLVVQGFISRKASLKTKGMIVAGLAFTGISLIILSVAGHVWHILAALAVLSVGGAIVTSYLPSFLSSNIDTNAEGEIMGIYEAVGSLSRIIGPLLASSVFFALGQYSYLIFGVILLGIAMLLRAQKRV